MLQRAKVIETEGKYAVIEVSRKAMCDGCHNSACGDGCPMGKLFGATSSDLRAKAVNRIGAKPGDTVFVETKTSTVMSEALLIFIIPIVLAAAGYAVAGLFSAADCVRYICAAAGFAVPMIVAGIVEKKKKAAEPEIIISEIII